ncbi:uncharacterized protein NEMAJ01_0923 [Nematocida major]|uniref:uncharacterized protein n=1 Tax=Nematocida major TaxID=1912982 RepID=UPI0020082145|nr:uncharacterized protein NEMAJ01_0923 [Nematocida major]KAH9386027.1 hypothetical protein NEMAJ01_0923 [Nematocida major]
MRTLKEKLSQSFLHLKASLEEDKRLALTQKASSDMQSALKKMEEMAQTKEDVQEALKKQEQSGKDLKEIKQGIEDLLKMVKPHKKSLKKIRKEQEKQNKWYLEKMRLTLSSSSSSDEGDLPLPPAPKTSTPQKDALLAELAPAGRNRDVFSEFSLRRGDGTGTRKREILHASSEEETSNEREEEVWKEKASPAAPLRAVYPQRPAGSSTKEAEQSRSASLAKELKERLVLNLTPDIRKTVPEKSKKEAERPKKPAARESKAIPTAAKITPVVIGGKIRAIKESPLESKEPEAQKDSSCETSSSDLTAYTDPPAKGFTFSNPEMEKVEDKLEFIKKQGTIEDDARLYGMLTTTIEKMKERKDFEAIKMSMQMDIARKYIKDFIDLRVALQNTQPLDSEQDRRNRRKKMRASLPKS